ncbi:hypothetical protein FVE85_1853 [Porphyridium purpureum]|uniref:Uncharacterized protein n=1 Tax=Porphyridium purpureum TaxID=35688 RepID=A0A5J4YX21_PORPP|nr:hypothetical protein FVE85_1853 [Porphyridium purpureum]|eukprot:POR3824..scf209_3
MERLKLRRYRPRSEQLLGAYEEEPDRQSAERVIGITRAAQTERLRAVLRAFEDIRALGSLGNGPSEGEGMQARNLTICLNTQKRKCTQDLHDEMRDKLARLERMTRLSIAVLAEQNRATEEKELTDATMPAVRALERRETPAREETVSHALDPH